MNSITPGETSRITAAAAGRTASASSERRHSRPPPAKVRVSPFEIIAAVLLGLAFTCGAYSAYQASLWSGNCLTNYNLGTITLNQSSKITLLAVQNLIFDGIVYVEDKTQRRLAEILHQPSRSELSEFWRNTVDDDFLTALTWAEKHETTPFESEEYINGRLAMAEELAQQGGAYFTAGQQANQTGNNFALVMVLCIAAMFFSGMAAIIGRLAFRAAFTFVGAGTLAVALIRMLTLPFA